SLGVGWRTVASKEMLSVRLKPSSLTRILLLICKAIPLLRRFPACLPMPRLNPWRSPETPPRRNSEEPSIHDGSIWRIFRELSSNNHLAHPRLETSLPTTDPLPEVEAMILELPSAEFAAVRMAVAGAADEAEISAWAASADEMPTR